MDVKHAPWLIAIAITASFLSPVAYAQENAETTKLEQKLNDLQKQIDALAAQGRALQEEINAARAKQTETAPAESAGVQTVEPASASEPDASTPPQPAAGSTDATSISDEPVPPLSTEAPTPPPMTIASGAGGRNYLNLSLDALLAAGTSTTPDVAALQTGGHDPIERGFTVQNVEAVFEGAVDPYFRGQANLILQINSEGETVVELEEIYATTTSLPKGLQVKTGHFFTEFGRLNQQHPHSWDFVDQPLVNGRFFGGDGLRSTGVRLSWLTPTDFFSEVALTLQNSQGETVSSFRSVPGETLFGRTIEERSVSSIGDMLIVPRFSAAFDLSDTQTLLVGGSAAFGPNGTGPDARTRIYGLDGFYKWKPTNAFRGFPFVKIQGEVMRRAASVAGVSTEAEAATFKDWGGYVQVNWGYKAGYVAGFRVERVGGDQGDPRNDALAPRLRLSPVLTWFPTEFSKLRLQYNLDRADAFQEAQHSVWLQLEFLLGAHAAHKF